MRGAIVSLAVFIACAQTGFAEQSRMKATIQLLESIGPAIEAYASTYPELKRKVARRLILCALIFNAIKDSNANGVKDVERLQLGIDSYFEASFYLMGGKAKTRSMADEAVERVSELFKRKDTLEMIHLLRNCYDFSNKPYATSAVIEVALED